MQLTNLPLIVSYVFPHQECGLDVFSCLNFRTLVEQLERVNVTQMEMNAQIAFWINMYNALVMHVITSSPAISFLLLQLMCV